MVTGDCLGFALCVMLKSMTRQRKRTVHKSIKDEKGASTKSYDKELQLQENVGRSFDQELSSPSQVCFSCPSPIIIPGISTNCYIQRSCPHNVRTESRTPGLRISRALHLGYLWRHCRWPWSCHRLMATLAHLLWLWLCPEPRHGVVPSHIRLWWN